MRFDEFKERVLDELSCHPEGVTWPELKTRQRLPYARPCPEWTARLERDCGLSRNRRRGRAKLWELIP